MTENEKQKNINISGKMILIGAAGAIGCIGLGYFLNKKHIEHLENINKMMMDSTYLRVKVKEAHLDGSTVIHWVKDGAKETYILKLVTDVVE